jgi:NAD(P)-dependent dehydrogenase (short-subunit alcohol dehydrogenase family)
VAGLQDPGVEETGQVGLGKAVALELAAAGAHGVCTGRSTSGRSTQEKLPALTIEAVIDEIRAAGGSAEAVSCDHTEPAQVEELIRRVAGDHGRLDILVNNAWGGHDRHDEYDYGEEVWDEPPSLTSTLAATSE